MTLQSTNLILGPATDSLSSINVSGGLYVSPANKETFGSAGTITLNAAVDLVDAQNSTTPEQDQFVLGGVQLAGYSGLKNGAGTLNLQAPLVQIGGTSLVNGGTAQETVQLTDNFFSEGGFGIFSITGVGDSTNAHRASVLVAPGTSSSNPNVIAPEVQSWLAQLNGGQYTLTPTTLALPSQRSAISISLNAPGVADPSSGVLKVQGNVVIGENAEISLAANSANSVSLDGGKLGTVAVLGQILVPGGSINIEADGNTSAIFNGGTLANAPETTVDLGPNSILNASGATALTQNLFGLRTGSVLNGGTISVAGNILGEQGSQILVNGASDTLAVSSGFSSAGGNLTGSISSSYVKVPVYSNGGNITLKGNEALLSEATLSGQAGGPTAVGGSLSVSAGSFFSFDENAAGVTKNFPDDASLILTNSGTTYTTTSGLSISTTTGAIGIPILTSSGQAGQGIVLTNPVSDVDGKTIYGYFSAPEFSGTGLASLNLNPSGNLEIATAGGNISLSAASSISFASAGVILLDDPTQAITVSLTAPYIDMGAYFTPAQQQAQQQAILEGTTPIPPNIFKNPNTGNPFALAPVPGMGTLNVNASTLVDVGDLALLGFDTLNINQSGLAAGDVGEVERLNCRATSTLMQPKSIRRASRLSPSPPSRERPPTGRLPLRARRNSPSSPIQ